MRQLRMQLLLYLFLLGLHWIQGEIFQRDPNILEGLKRDPIKTDGCPRHLRLCNDECLDRSTNHTSPCHVGPWGKCLSANFPFYCNLTDTCIRKHQMCGDHCFDGSPGSFWYDHKYNDDHKNNDVRMPNMWKLEEDTVYEKQDSWGGFSINKWLERYNCNGKCITHLELCNNTCDHPEHILISGSHPERGNLRYWPSENEPLELVKCGNTCKETIDVKEFHDCGDECLPRNKPCNGTCPLQGSRRGDKEPQWLCGNECRPTIYGLPTGHKACPDGTCRHEDMNCEGPLPGTCPDGSVLCRHYDISMRRTGFSCWSSSQYYICNEIRNNTYITGRTKHNDDWCFKKNEPCQGECIPGYIKCRDAISGVHTCKNSTEYIKYGEECRESANYFICDGNWKSSKIMCNGVCAEGFEKCGKGCVTENSNVECNGECQRPERLCNGECPKPGWFKALETHTIRKSTETDEDICKPNNLKDNYHECNGIFLEYKLPCNGTCVQQYEGENRRLCRGGKCLTESESWECDGECIEGGSYGEHCNGVCEKRGYVTCGKTCLSGRQYRNRQSSSRQSSHRQYYSHQQYSRMHIKFRENSFEPDTYYSCGDQCIEAGVGPVHISCNGTCREGLVLCGDKCVGNRSPCGGECTQDSPFKCITRHGEQCIEADKLGNGLDDCLDGSDEECLQLWSCNGKQQSVNKPCHNHDPSNGTVSGWNPRGQCSTDNIQPNQTQPIQTICPPSVDKQSRTRGSRLKEYAMYYCPAHDDCRLEGVPCNGTCMLDFHYLSARDQFACEDGSKCISKRELYNDEKDCPDGSDEIVRCQGDIDCSQHIVIKNSFPHLHFRCENGDTDILMEKFCDGKEDCGDGSDEVCDKCPGVVKCRNRELVCANVPCNNTGRNNGLEDLTCEREGWDLCHEEPGHAKCVKSAVNSSSESYRKAAVKAAVGETCNGQCLAGLQCGDKCIPEDNGWYLSCNGSCHHIDTTRIIPQIKYHHEMGRIIPQFHSLSTPKMVLCDGYCIEEQELKNNQIFRYDQTFECDGECRVHRTEEQRIKSRRRTCQGTCLHPHKDGSDQWFPCDSGNECFSPEEWCNGVRDCQDGSDEAACQHCPSIKRCYGDSHSHKPSHPNVNQTSSNGPRFPDFVCVNEPCGDCSDKGTFPCGNRCIPKDQLCSLSGLCFSPTQFKCDKCLEAEAVCDGKADCEDGSDEDDCLDSKGSWLCNGVIQSKTKPCFQ